ncbi:MAG: hypothetical protein GFH27_549313n38 [Chloroflexi bacterium AL-W]|nr:hypothetical protein [Chloroflexi bacterium AL-N1]NOK69461.1 hypothetical protein [Chloroflexi bacterium AL-N10]NOK77426.1 hypothetical protein [Chloroflexi bacterium AL-N5]NOK84277.1 hypothetical protein [Chloroflexi bacterium AL-W]NOK91558.1 hypothetical protein [Chloroflexi bacterium AL-N15]
MTATILVIGSTGMLGKSVVWQLLTDGYNVRLFSRTPNKVAAELSAVCNVVGGDIEDENSVENALRGCDGVHLNLNGGTDPDLEYRGAKVVARVAARHNIQRITYLSGATVCEENG